MTIKVSCFTNLDDFRTVEWPKYMIAMPRIGDRVEGIQGNFRPTLRVISVTHHMSKEYVDDSNSRQVWLPRVRIELHR